MKEKNNWLKIIFFLSLIGVVISLYLTKIHYSENKSFCDINSQFSCSIVNRSEHAEFWGMSVALLGVLGYSFLGLIGWGLYRGWGEKLKGANEWLSSQSLLFFSGLAFLVSLYLTYTEFFVIGAICLMCLGSQINILGITFFSYKNYKERRIVKSKEVAEEVGEGGLKLSEKN